MQYCHVGIAELQMYRKNISESSGSEYRKYVSKSLHNYLPTKHLRTLILPQSIKYQGPVLHCHSCAAQFRMCMCLLYTADSAAAFWAPGFGRTRVRPVTKASEIANSNCMRTFLPLQDVQSRVARIAASVSLRLCGWWQKSTSKQVLFGITALAT